MAGCRTRCGARSFSELHASISFPERLALIIADYAGGMPACTAIVDHMAHKLRNYRRRWQNAAGMHDVVVVHTVSCHAVAPPPRSPIVTG